MFAIYSHSFKFQSEGRMEILPKKISIWPARSPHFSVHVNHWKSIFGIWPWWCGTLNFKSLLKRHIHIYPHYISKSKKGEKLTGLIQPPNRLVLTFLFLEEKSLCSQVHPASSLNSSFGCKIGIGFSGFFNRRFSTQMITHHSWSW